MGKLADKNILITGGNSGIGLAAAQEFDREGARVAICGLNEGTLQAAKETRPSASCVGVRLAGRMAEISLNSRSTTSRLSPQFTDMFDPISTLSLTQSQKRKGRYNASIP